MPGEAFIKIKVIPGFVSLFVEIQGKQESSGHKA